MTELRVIHDGLTLISIPGHGAEDVLVDDEGCVYTGTEDGSVFKVRYDGHRIDRVGTTEGRPLGLEFLPDGRILVCDAKRGLLAMDPADGKVEVLTALVGGRPLVFCNNAAVDSSGVIYFSDSSRIHPIERWKADIVEDTRSRAAAARADVGEACGVAAADVAAAEAKANGAGDGVRRLRRRRARLLVRRVRFSSGHRGARAQRPRLARQSP